jgi:threonine/homoserine/homoserine lactone efflux protein
VIQVLTFLAMGIASITTWTLFGSALRPFLTSHRSVRAFNIAMALLLLASLYPVFTD